MYFRNTQDVLCGKIIEHGIGILHVVSKERISHASSAVWRRICRNDRRNISYQNLKSVIDLLVEYGALKQSSCGGYLFDRFPEVHIAAFESLIEGEKIIDISQQSLEVASELGSLWKNDQRQYLSRSAFNARCLGFKRSHDVPSYVVASAVHDLFLSGCMKSQSQSMLVSARIPQSTTRFYREAFRQYFSSSAIEENACRALSDFRREHRLREIASSSALGQKNGPHALREKSPESAACIFSVAIPACTELDTLWRQHLKDHL